MSAAGEALVLGFGAVGSGDGAVVGGKGANLGELAGAGFPVPPGFVVTTAAFRRFLAGVPEREALYEALDAVAADDVAAARAAGARVRSSLGGYPVPPEVAEAIRAAWLAAGPDGAFAARSSATAEDLAGASFAGQQDSFLNLVGEPALLAGIRDCWVSLFTDRAILYRARGGFGHRDVALAVVVQRMVPAEASGILFTADPVTGHRHHAVIEAGFGLGEALVGGLITPDHFLVDARTGTLLEREIGDKALAIRPDPAGGTVQVPLEGPERTAPAIPDAVALELAALGQRVAAHYGAPQDIEWARSGDDLYLVQSRPITTLYPLVEPEPDDGALHLFLSFGHLQVMTDAMPPLARDVFPLIFPVGRIDGGPSPYLRVAGSRIYADATALLAHAPARHLLPRLLAVAEAEISAGVAAVAARPEFRARAHRAAGQLSPLALAGTFLPIFGQILAWLLWRDPASALPAADGRLADGIAAARARVDGAPPGTARLAAACAALDNALPRLFPRFIPMIAPSILARALLERVAGPYVEPADLAALGRGLAGNVTLEMDLAVGDLADLARAHPAVAERLSAQPADEALDGLDAVAGGSEFLEAWRAFLARYGMRGGSEIDISRPRWRDDPAPLIQAVVGNLGAPPGAHRERQARQAAAGAAAAARVEAACRRGLLGPLRAAVAGRLAAVLRGLTPVREHPKLLIIQLFDLLRAEVLAAAEALVAAGRLSARDEVWFLSLAELRQAAAAGPDLAPLVAARRAAFQADRPLRPPPIFTSDGERPQVAVHAQDLPPGTLAGTAASAGVVEGVARVVRDPAREVLTAGEILVAPFTDPGWTPLFINARALVMEVGGLMTHGSVVAREYGIPAVVGVREATTRLKTGDRIRVDGDRGLVELLGPPHSE